MKFIAIFTLFLAVGCTKTVDEIPVPTCLVEVQVHAQKQSITRAIDEETITDVNFFLFRDDGVLTVSSYTVDVSPLRFECLPGMYRLYIIANLHRDIGRMDETELKALRLEQGSSYDTLPMSAVTDISIENAANTLAPIEVKRNVARIEYDIRIDSTMKGKIALEQVRYVNLPKYGMPFSDELPQTFTRSPAYSAGAEGHSGMFYMFPNEQGIVPEITSQDQRNTASAPENGTYILIYARYENRVVNFIVHLGENNTNDFNVRANSVQILSINIKGLNTVDTRVDTYILLHHFNGDRIGDYYIPGEHTGYIIRRGGSADTAAATCRYEWLEGDAAQSNFFAAGAKGDRFPLPRNQQVNYWFAYKPKFITQENNHTRHRFTITDAMDHVTTIDQPLTWANSLIVLCSGGTAVSTNALALEENSSDKRFACMEECRLRAEAADNYVFDGWYKDARSEELISKDEEFCYTLTQARETIYARFRTRQVYIYTDIDTVDLVCNRTYTIDRERRAFCVPYGSECTISARPTSYIINWYDGYDFDTARWLGFSIPYSFVATEDRTIAPQQRTEYPLDTNGTANCYIFTPETALRSFDATVQGNGRATRNITPKKIVGGAKAVVLWHTDNFAPVKNVAYRDGRIYFLTVQGGTGANAVIGLLDASGKVLWSWHIWRTADPETKAQTYSDGRTFMDRNLGSNGARVSGGESIVYGYGFYYQWGRKDPFIFPNRYSETKPCTDAKYMKGFEPQQTTFTNGTTPEWAAAHPTTFINGSEVWTDWLPRHNMNLWGNPAATIYDTGRKSEKTIYDPCPPGWRVPDENAWTADEFYIVGFAGIGYMYLATSYMDQYYYPVGGYLLNGSFVNVKSQAAYWTDSPAWVGPQSTSYRSDASHAMIVDEIGMFKKYGYLRRDAGAMVRCMRDE